MTTRRGTTSASRSLVAARKPRRALRRSG
jgi:hypothetical protein